LNEIIEPVLEPVLKSVLIDLPENRKYELDLTFFSSYNFKEDKKRKLIAIFRAARDLSEWVSYNIFPVDVYLQVRDSITDEEFTFLYNFAKDILRIFKRGTYVIINEECEFVINCESVR
jgi:hypothetical protein